MDENTDLLQEPAEDEPQTFDEAMARIEAAEVPAESVPEQPVTETEPSQAEEPDYWTLPKDRHARRQALRDMAARDEEFRQDITTIGGRTHKEILQSKDRAIAELQAELQKRDDAALRNAVATMTPETFRERMKNPEFADRYAKTTQPAAPVDTEFVEIRSHITGEFERMQEEGVPAERIAAIQQALRDQQFDFVRDASGQAHPVSRSRALATFQKATEWEIAQAQRARETQRQPARPAAAAQRPVAQQPAPVQQRAQPNPALSISPDMSPRGGNTNGKRTQQDLEALMDDPDAFISATGKGGAFEAMLRAGPMGRP